MMRLLVRDNGKVHLVVTLKETNAKLWIIIFRGYLHGASPVMEQGYCMAEKLNTAQYLMSVAADANHMHGRAEWHFILQAGHFTVSMR